MHIPQQVQRRMRDALDLMGGSKKNDAGDDAAHHSKRVRESPKSAWDEDIDADMGEGTPSGAHEPNPVLSNALREAQRQQQAAGKVQRMMEYRKKLPAWKKRDLLLQAVRENQVLVVSGETGKHRDFRIVQTATRWVLKRSMCDSCISSLCTPIYLALPLHSTVLLKLISLTACSCCA